jgi:23S rRNA pseudouridine1911/1915/1917 synthase
MYPELFPIVFEDDELLVINKPAGLVCHPTKTDEFSSLVGRVRLYLGSEIQGQLVNRLDRETSGVTLIAKRADVAREIRRLWEQRLVTKEYLAIVHGALKAPYTIINESLGRDERSRVAIKDCVRPDGVPASTEIWRLWVGNSLSVLRVEPRTGRKHQIRIHLAHIGHAIVGDKLYGEDEDLYMALVENRLTPAQRQQLILPYHALHARAVRFQWRGRETVFRAEPEAWFLGFLSQLGAAESLQAGLAEAGQTNRES